jgi:hypothetical protein
MKNKEIEELLNELKDKYSYEPYDNTGNVYTTISYEEGQLLLSYIEQLEKIPNKALNFIHENSYKKGDGTIMYDTDIQKLEDILKGGSDDE